jgi:hypothetical protein
MKATAAKILRGTQIVMLTCHLFVNEQVYKLSLHDIGIPSRVFIFQTHLLYTFTSTWRVVSLYPLTYVEQSAKDTCGTGTALYTQYKKSNQIFHCFYLFVRILLLLHTWHCRINTIYVHCRQIYILFVPIRDPLFFLFLKLVRINCVFPNNMYIVYVYIH